MEFCTNHKEALDKDTIKKKINQGIDVEAKPWEITKEDGSKETFDDITKVTLKQKEEVAA